VKPFKETTELIALLEDRGLNIDSSDGDAFLHDFNYYRFSGYSRQFQLNPGKQNNQYESDASLSDIRSIIHLDAELRRLLGSALASVELSVRARFAHECGRILGERGFYLDPNSYLPVAPGLDGLIEKMRDDLRRSKSPTVARYAVGDSYDAVPIWVAVEVLSFGAVAKMIQYLADDAPAKQVARSYSLAWDGFQSTIHAFAVLRNQCAHHGQIWHRKPSIQTPVPKKLRPRDVSYDPQGTYPAIIMLKRYLKEIVPENSWGTEVEALLVASDSLRRGVLNPFAK
jgi:abortive infection bacteriophage resistance protein